MPMVMPTEYKMDRGLFSALLSRVSLVCAGPDESFKLINCVWEARCVFLPSYASYCLTAARLEGAVQDT